MVGMRNIDNVMTELSDRLGYKYSDISWDFIIQGSIGTLEMHLNTSDILHESIQKPVMNMAVHIGKYEEGQQQLVFLVHNSIFRQTYLDDIMNFLSMAPIEV
jgi:hypothetical protein